MTAEHPLTNIEKALRKLYPELRQKYQVQKLGIFGSYIRQEQHQDSDIDILVAFSDPPSLFKYIELENLIGDYLGIKVDLVMEDALKPNMKDRIMREVQYI